LKLNVFDEKMFAKEDVGSAFHRDAQSIIPVFLASRSAKARAAV
jgi:hypothetical protein